MSEDESRIITRAENLAIVHLTRRPDLHLASPLPWNEGLDYIVYMFQDNQPTRRHFGVQIQGAEHLPSDSSDMLLSPYEVEVRPIHWHAEQPIPMCSFLFDVTDERGFYRWLHAPVVTEEGQPELHGHPSSALCPLDRAALDTIVAQVQAWYAAQGHFAEPVVLTAN